MSKMAKVLVKLWNSVLGFILISLASLPQPANSQEQKASCSDDCTAFIREIIAIATRDAYCHADSKCSNASIGQVRSLAGGALQCGNTIFGPTGVPGSYPGNSFQTVSGQCYTFNTAGQPVVASNSPPLPLDGANLPAIWTGISCFAEASCLGSRAAVVYNWRDCVDGSYPGFDNVPGRINGKSFFWGNVCINIRLNGKELIAEPVTP